MTEFTWAIEQNFKEREILSTRQQLVSWIPCKRAMPNDNNKKLICTFGDCVDTGYYDGNVWRDFMGRPIRSHIVYWAHLPRPPVRNMRSYGT